MRASASAVAVASGVYAPGGGSAAAARPVWTATCTAAAGESSGKTGDPEITGFAAGAGKKQLRRHPPVEIDTALVGIAGYEPLRGWIKGHEEEGGEMGNGVGRFDASNTSDR